MEPVCDKVRAPRSLHRMASLFSWHLTAAILVVCSPWCRGQDYSVRIGWIHYQDNVGRDILYDFSTGSMDQSGVVTIPPGAVLSRPADESGTNYLWEPLYAQQNVSLENGVYRISVPQPLESPPSIPTASIVIDGSVSEWTSVATYIADRVGDSWAADVDYVKLAYSDGGSKLNILIKTADAIRQDVWYRLFLDRDLDGKAGDPGDFTIDLQYNGTAWDVVSQGNTEDGWDWYAVEEQGVVVVSGQFIEASVSASAFGLPGDLNVYGRTMQSTSPYATRDVFTSNFLETSGFVAIGANNAGSLVPDEWEFSARISDFDNIQVQRDYSVNIRLGSSENDDLEACLEAGWVTGCFEGIYYSRALIIGAEVENDLDGQPGEYDWEWGYGEGGGLLVSGLDPATTVLDLKVVVSNSGRTASFYYRTNSDDASGWQLAVSHTIPADVGRIYGVFDTLPAIGLETGYVESAAHLMHDWNGDGFVSIIGDVPPFVQCVYFQNCPDWPPEKLLDVGDCNGDGFISIIGDVPCFVDCVYFGNCPN